MTADLNRLGQAGVEALRRGDGHAARLAFDRIEAAGRGTHQLRLLLAQACTLAGDAPAAHRALDAVLREEPTNLYALILRGDLFDRAGDPRAAVSWYQAALAQAPRAGALSPDLIAALKRAEASVERSGATFQAHLERQLATAGIDVPAIGPRFGEALDILTGRAPVQPQQPTSFYYPRLAPIPFFDSTSFDWVEALEAATPALRAELEAVLADANATSPYVKADPDRPAKRHALLGDPNWSAFHFYDRGVPIDDHTARCPATMAALAPLPIPHIAGRSPTAMFSVLRARTHIPPHTGMLNTRLICHLPLIVPPGCRLRVGNETRSVEAGRVMIFDDSIEHEAWNDSGETRTVLLFEIWHPELAAAERAALTALYEAIEANAPTAGDQGGAQDGQ